MSQHAGPVTAGVAGVALLGGIFGAALRRGR
jgi:hypothetical protein